jgi:hypothetical protein
MVYKNIFIKTKMTSNDLKNDTNDALKKILASKNLDTETINLIMKATNTSKKTTHNLCLGAVKITVRSQVNKAITDNVEVYKVMEKNKTVYYKQCSRNSSEKSEFCNKHNSDTSKLFKDIINLENSNLMTKSDLLDIKDNKSPDDENNNDPIISLNVNQTIQNKVLKIMKKDAILEEKKEKEKSSNKKDTTSVKDKSEKDKSEKDKSEKDKSVKDKSEKDKSVKDKSENDKSIKDKSEKDKSENDKSEKETSEKEKDSDDEESEIDAIEIQTQDGKKFALVNEEDVYDVDTDEASQLIGKLMKVSDKSAPILYKGDNYIIGKSDVIENKITMTRCVYSNRLYKMNGSKLEKVGIVVKNKDNTYKVKLDKK